MRRASNSIRDGHANASSPPRQISSANTNSSQIPHRWIVNPHGNCLSGGMMVVRNRSSLSKRAPTQQGWGQCMDRCGSRGTGIGPHESQLAATWDVPPNMCLGLTRAY
jgi:hypothetical protein